MFVQTTDDTHRSFSHEGKRESSRANTSHQTADATNLFSSDEPRLLHIRNTDKGSGIEILSVDCRLVVRVNYDNNDVRQTQ